MKRQYVLLSCLFLLSLQGFAQTAYKDVASIFYNRCTTCHHAGQHGQSMMNYSETQPYITLIQHDLSTSHMPPWPPDTLYTRFIHEHIITTSEKSAILAWISGGALKGDTTLAPAAPIYPTGAKLIGTPDLILTIPTFTSNATTTVDAYNCFALPSGLTADRILRAYEIIPGNIPIVHHVVVTIDTTGSVSSSTAGNCFNQPGQIGIGGYTPGCSPTIFPSQAPLMAGIRIKSGSKLILQIHYPAGTVGQKDSTQIRLFFYPVGTTGIRPMHVTTNLQNWSIGVPANTIMPFTAKYPSSGGLPGAVSIFALEPHSHKVCTSMRICAYNNVPTDTIPLINVPKWDFNWQGFYTYPKMVKVPAGYTLYARHIYDNTTANPNNPFSPPQLITAGTSTTNEMLFDSFMWLNYQAGDDTINIAHIIDSDPLMTGIPEHNNPGQKITSVVYPNPSNGQAVIYITNIEQLKNCELHIYNMVGKEVHAQKLPNASADGFHIEAGVLAPGVYLYNIRSGTFSGSGKLLITN
ncbi:MAG: T9SS type A sorting domain-containing protein [Bacteroidia bacterium]